VRCSRLKSGDKIKLNKLILLLLMGSRIATMSTVRSISIPNASVLFQYDLYAEGKRSLLICLQGLDAAGKDGTIAHVLGAMDPQGTRVCGFKVPTLKKLAMTSCGALKNRYRRKVRWSSSTAPIMKTFWWSGCTKQSPKKFGQIVIV